MVIMWTSPAPQWTTSPIANLASELGNDLIIAKVNSAGELDIYNEAGSVDLVIDLVGFFAAPDACAW